ncbi:sensor histidine kinase [Actinokineospora guangxiensis]|uniref:histidine kinase n=1 Tax=Actinokineospora guangxiensis TaxID=1490288 RepID=A0ABW0EL75_9PSEU
MEQTTRPWQTPAWHAVVTFGFGSLLFSVDFPLVVVNAFFTAPDAVRLLVLGAICALQLLRERAPVAALLAAQPLVALDAAMGLSLPALLAAGDLVYASVLYGSRRASRVLLYGAFGFVAVAAAIGLTIGKDMRESTLFFLATAPLPLLPVWWATNVRRQREAADAERARADQLSHIADLERARADSQARIAELDRDAAVHAARAAMARDLHDVIAGHISAVAIQSEALLSRTPGDPETTRTVLTSVRENSVAALTEMRAMIGFLRSPTPDARTAPARLRDLETLVVSARAAGLDVHTTTDLPTPLPAAVDLSAYRIVQEALTNAIKHGGNHAEVTVRQTGPHLLVQVVNDIPSPSSPSFSPSRTPSPSPSLPTSPTPSVGPTPPRTGTGLLTMTERATAIGGHLAAGPHSGRWHVRADLPLTEP